MMLRIGNNLLERFALCALRYALCVRRTTHNAQSFDRLRTLRRRTLSKVEARTTQFGFTLIEVMAATAVLSLGIVLIYEAFFISLDSFDYCDNYLNVAPWMDEKVWAVENDIRCFGTLTGTETKGEFRIGSKNLDWLLSYDVLDKEQALYKIDLEVSWQEGKRKIKLTRNAYAMFEKKE